MHQMHQKRLVHDPRVRNEPAHLEIHGRCAPVSPPSTSAGTRPRPHSRCFGGGPAGRALRLVPTASTSAGVATAVAQKGSIVSESALRSESTFCCRAVALEAAPPAPLRSVGVVGIARRRVTCRAQRERLNAGAQARRNRC